LYTRGGIKVKKKLLGILLLIAIVLVGVYCFILAKQGMKENQNKEQFITTFNKLIEMDTHDSKGNVVIFQKFDSDKYGRFVPLLNTEMNYYSELYNIERTFEDTLKKLNGSDFKVNKPEDINNLKELPRELTNLFDNFTKAIKALNETNIKEIEGLVLEDKYKQFYLDAKKEVNNEVDLYMGKLSVVVSDMTKSLTEAVIIVEKMPTRKNQAEIDKDLKLLQELITKTETANSQIKDLDKEYKSKIVEISKNYTEKLKSI
jgi:hypothetical protein